MKAGRDLIIIGAGVIGLGIAWRASQRGLDTLVIERHPDLPPRAGPSWVAAGMLAPVTEAQFGEERLTGFNLESRRRYPSFLEELRSASGRDITFTSEGTLYVALNRDQSEALERLLGFQRSLGLPAQPLDAATARSLEASLHPSVRGGIHAPGDVAVDPRGLSAALLSAARAGGAEVLAGAEVTDLGGGRGSWTVTTSSGEDLGAREVVLAGGWDLSSIEGIPDWLGAALRPVKGQILRLGQRKGEPPLITHNIRTEDVYIVPRPWGEVVVGATVEEMGADVTVTAGGVFELLRGAEEVVPGIRELELTESSAGLRPATPDNAPLLGRIDDDGPIVAAGHHRNGILLTPITADCIVELLTSGEPPEEILPFSPTRFRRRAA